MELKISEGHAKKILELLTDEEYAREFADKLLAGNFQEEIDEMVDIIEDQCTDKTAKGVASVIFKEHDFRYHRETFYVWTGKLWRAEDRETRTLKRIVAKSIMALGIPYSVRFSNDVIDLIRSLVPSFESDTRYRIYVFENGTLYYDRGEWEWKPGHWDPEDGVRDDENPMFPFEFDPDATAPEAMEVFGEWGVDPEQILAFASYGLFQRGNPHNICLNLSGEGANGKSMLLKFLGDLVPETSLTHLNPTTLSQTHSGAELMERSYFNLTGETKFKKTDTTAFKDILGGDPIAVNPKFKQQYTIRVSCKFVFSTNHPIELLETTKGDIRRFLIVPFPNEFATDHTFYDRRLRPLIQGFFADCLRYSRKLWTEGLYINEEYRDRTREHILSSSNNVYDFVSEIELEWSPEPKNSRGLYYTYKRYCETNGLIPKSSRRLWSEIQTLVVGKRVYQDPANRHNRHLKWNEVKAQFITNSL